MHNYHVLSALLGALLLGFVAECAAQNEKCAGGYSDVVEFAGCSSVRLPDFNVRFVDNTQPMKDVPIICWNYEATHGAEKAKFQQCHSGALGGTTTFSLSGKSFTVVFDVSAGCKQLPTGMWTSASVGYAFYKGLLSASDLANMGQAQSQICSDCYARNKTSSN